MRRGMRGPKAGTGIEAGTSRWQLRSHLGRLGLLVPQVRGLRTPFCTEMFQRYQGSEEKALVVVGGSDVLPRSKDG